MISVLNRRQRLSGSKIFFIFFWCVTFSASCGLFTKKAIDKRPPRHIPPSETEVIKEIDNEGIVDGIFDDENTREERELTEVEKERFEREKQDLLEKKTYEISFLIPAKSALIKHSTENIPEEQKRLINFYIGAQIAVDSLKKLGLNFKFSSFDVENPSTSISALLSTKKISNSTAIIGLTKQEHFLELSANENLKDTWIISPWNNNYNLAREHNKLVFMRSGTDAFARTMFSFANQHYKSKEIIIVHTNSPREKIFLESFDNEIKLLNYSTSYGVPKVVNIENTISELVSLLEKNSKSLIIFPNWFDHTSVFKLMNSLSNNPDLQNVTIMGLPQWKEFPMVNFNLFEKFQVIIPESFYPNIKNRNVLRFAEKFFDHYGSSHFTEALYGFEITMLTAELLLKYGNDSFAKAKPSDFMKYSGNFSFTKTNKWSSPENIDENFDFIENDKIFLTQFKKFRYEILDVAY